MSSSPSLWEAQDAYIGRTTPEVELKKKKKQSPLRKLYPSPKEGPYLTVGVHRSPLLGGQGKPPSQNHRLNSSSLLLTEVPHVCIHACYVVGANV